VSLATFVYKEVFIVILPDLLLIHHPI